MGEGAFDFCDILHILFGVGVISSRECVLATSTSLIDGADYELLMMLQGNDTSFGWH